MHASQGVRLTIALCFTLILLVGDSVFAAKPLVATHKQTHRIPITHDGEKAKLNTFCLNREGNILACVGATVPNQVQVYSPEGKLIRSTRLEFNPTAINEAPDGTIYVGGSGKIAHLSADGKLLVVVDSPNIGDPEETNNLQEKQIEEQLEQMTKAFDQQLKQIAKRIKAIEDKPKEERSDRDKLRLRSFKQQQELYQTQIEQTEEMFREVLSSGMMGGPETITSLAVTSKDVFICCGQAAGHGYEVWRTNRELSEPEKVVDSLGGCCGQCDIQANEEYLVLAENSRFRVGLLDRDGKRITSFGKQDKTSKTGFASCCNPMNVRCCNNGDILTAESSIGSIKRFNADGECIANIGRAKIGGGCKHVALGFDEKQDRYYVQYEDRNEICVLVPLAEAPEFTEDELLAKAAREGLAKKLLNDGDKLSGEWSLDGKRPKKKVESGIFGLLGSLFGSAEESEVAVESDNSELTEEQLAEQELLSVDMSDMKPQYLHFHADGKLEAAGQMFDYDQDSSWEAVSQDLKANTLRVSYLSEGISYYDFQIEFLSDTEIKLAVMYGHDSMATAVYQRLPRDAADAEKADAVKTTAPAFKVSPEDTTRQESAE